MGKWEREVYRVAACPCGTGRIDRVVESPDGPWSRPYTSYELDCAACSANWHMSPDGTLTERASEADHRAASAASARAATALQDYLTSLLARFSFPPFTRKVDEFDFLVEQGLYRGTIGKYRHARRTREMRDLAVVRSVSSIVPRLVAEHGDIAHYNALVDAAKSAAEQAAAKSKAVKSMHF